MRIRNLPGGKGRPARKADFTAICEPIRKCEILDVSQPCGPPRPVTGIDLPFMSQNHNHDAVTDLSVLMLVNVVGAGYHNLYESPERSTLRIISKIILCSH
jgi:hypothetical protein